MNYMNNKNRNVDELFAIYQDLPSVPSLCAEDQILNTFDISVR